MKKFGIRIFCLLMAFQVLFASTGFAMTEHFCKIKGKETYLFSRPKSCCLEKKNLQNTSSQTSLKKQKCCDDKTSYQKIQTPSQLKNLQNNESGKVLGEILPISSLSILGQWHTDRNSVLCATDHGSNSPPLYGRSLLIFVQTFLI
jgi:hypothetical protein